METNRRRFFIAAIALIAVVLVILAVRQIAAPKKGLTTQSPTVGGLEAGTDAGADEENGSGKAGSRIGKTKIVRVREQDSGKQWPGSAKLGAFGAGTKLAGARSDTMTSEADTKHGLQTEVNARIARHRTFGYSPGDPNSEVDQMVARALVSRTKNDMRSMATGIESYYVDNSNYPAYTTGTARMQVTGSSMFGPVPGPLQHGDNAAASTLTTPIAYLTSYFQDPFAINPSDTFAYYAPDSLGWITFSPGPDGKYDLDWSVYDPKVAQPSPELLTYMYDPTNGLLSEGDVFRVKQ